MINKITFIDTKDTLVYSNMALEEYLMLHCQKDEVILYLWQNSKTIVIGRNQNLRKECLADKLKNDGGYPSRRLSGGGAVFHDLGNLNFTFLAQSPNYNVEKQLQVILEAVKMLGIDATKSGRNDIVIEGKKFSGNAFYKQGPHHYHHGTIMVDVNKEDLGKYLTVSEKKLSAKGVKSVKSRVCNLIDYKKDITIDQLKSSLLEAFQKVYSLNANIIEREDLDLEELAKREELFSSWEWVYGRDTTYSNVFSNRFSFGLLDISFETENQIIKKCKVHTDALETEIFDKIEKHLIDTPFGREELSVHFKKIPYQNEKEKEVLDELSRWFLQIDL